MAHSVALSLLAAHDYRIWKAAVYSFASLTRKSSRVLDKTPRVPKSQPEKGSLESTQPPDLKERVAARFCDVG
jgi:hypothetical protein